MGEEIMIKFLKNLLGKQTQLEDTLRRRVSASKGQIVILDETSPSIYHGHVKEWHDLSERMQNILIDNGYVSRSGEILVGDADE